ncbi:SERTA domain-containing protein 2-like [Ascaphus truei]|uniref:SERTA domain-containing protein 2-like n=1 Tax=Ascaphus truei TaxID=8439 RepID=UPI003F5A5949
MPTKGTKRKFSDWEEAGIDGHPSLRAEGYSFIRQSLLNMSLDKFNKGRMMVEPSLRRSVLIANTLRIIQEEIRRDNSCPVLGMGVPGTDYPSPGDVGGLRDQSPRIVTETHPSSIPEDLENILLSSAEEDFSFSAAISSILRELENVSDEGSPQNLLRLSGIQDPEARLEFGLNASSPLTPRLAQLEGSCVEAVKEDMGKEAVFASNSDTRPLEVNEDIELISELVLDAAYSENLHELPVAMDTSLLKEVSAEASDSAVPEAPVVMDTSSALKEVPGVAQSMHKASTGLTQGLRTMEPVFGSFEIMSSSYLKDLSLDDPFSDIDTSVFEREVSALGAGSFSRSYAAEDLLFPFSCNSMSYNSSQGGRDSNELDNIIEILVGS